MTVFEYAASSFDLVGELFKPGMRQEVLKQARGGSLRASAQPFRPTPAAVEGVVNPIIGDLGNQADAERRIHQQLEDNANRPLWTGENVSRSWGETWKRAELVTRG